MVFTEYLQTIPPTALTQRSPIISWLHREIHRVYDSDCGYRQETYHTRCSLPPMSAPDREIRRERMRRRRPSCRLPRRNQQQSGDALRQSIGKFMHRTTREGERKVEEPAAGGGRTHRSEALAAGRSWSSHRWKSERTDGGHLARGRRTTASDGKSS